MAKSSNTRIEFIDAGFKAILQSEGCHEVVTSVTEDICAKANGNNTRGGSGFESSVIFGGRANRYVGFVNSTDKASAIAESEDGALSRAIL